VSPSGEKRLKCLEIILLIAAAREYGIVGMWVSSPQQFILMITLYKVHVISITKENNLIAFFLIMYACKNVK